jgi:predicted DNA binding CopG/RHH family protein
MKKKPIPRFKDEPAEQTFWSKADSTDHLDWSEARPVTLPRLRPTLKTISLRLPVALIAELKLLANRRDVPYQSLLKTYLADRVRDELTKKAPSAGPQHGVSKKFRA